MAITATKVSNLPDMPSSPSESCYFLVSEQAGAVYQSYRWSYLSCLARLSADVGSYVITSNVVDSATAAATVPASDHNKAAGVNYVKSTFATQANPPAAYTSVFDSRYISKSAASQTVAGAVTFSGSVAVPSPATYQDGTAVNYAKLTSYVASSVPRLPAVSGTPGAEQTIDAAGKTSVTYTASADSFLRIRSEAANDGWAITVGDKRLVSMPYVRTAGGKKTAVTEFPVKAGTTLTLYAAVKLNGAALDVTATKFAASSKFYVCAFS